MTLIDSILTPHSGWHSYHIPSSD